ncbi:Putative fatty acyl-CoA reductase CG5065 [Papilio machaon]|uniref:Fatty acyl-CoA reductase n=1 Tax=Papilio machaon TaxID=76193 RepID=A0A194R4R4_PAPMA|nr:Putative fatty acyl-CoA reductase CG5065 [Papilio machaon]
MESMLALEREAQDHQHDVAKIIASGASDVERFYAGSNIFLTGGTGFIGKHIIEKLFRCCNVNKVYLLLRSKKGKTVQQRIDQILKDPVFESLQKYKPDFVTNIIPIEGDISEKELGIGADDRNIITEQVNVIIHAAANVNFNENVKAATLINVRGIREIVRLAKCCKQLRSIVHVSTAYSHASKSRVRQAVKEQFYDSPIPPNAIIEMAETIEKNKLENMMQQLLKDYTNTYTFTKAVAEEVIRTEARGLPICIVRPSIVISSYREPLPGWVDPWNLNSPSGFVLGAYTGIIHVARSTGDVVISLVPVDIVTNTILVAAQENAKRQPDLDNTKIYNVTNNRNPLLWGQYIKINNTSGRNLISSRAIWYCFFIETPYKLLSVLLFWLLHFVPAFLVDIACKLIGKRPILIQTYKKIYKLTSALEFFMNNEWKFQDDNTLNLYLNLSNIDRDIFNCDMATIDNKEMTHLWAYGVRKYIIKDVNVKNADQVARKQFLLKIVTYFILVLYIYVFYKIIMTGYSIFTKFV